MRLPFIFSEWLIPGIPKLISELERWTSWNAESGTTQLNIAENTQSPTVQNIGPQQSQVLDPNSVQANYPGKLICMVSNHLFDYDDVDAVSIYRQNWPVDYALVVERPLNAMKLLIQRIHWCVIC
jgi:hypothetical protein